MKKICIVLLFVLATPLIASTIANDDSCDISVQPAATLLLPYFEVDFKSPQSTAVTTLFTIQNVSPQPQIAAVTLWTDRAYPALTFSVFLTGYDVQPINLYDVFARAVIAPGNTPAGGGTSSTITIPVNPTLGSQPLANNSNPNFKADVPTVCARLPGVFTPTLLTDLQSIFTIGDSTGNLQTCTNPPGPHGALGNGHDHAIGYITIDVVATCSTANPGSQAYFANLLFDNVLTGDYQVVVPRAEKSYAQGGPMVHIRAIPEGGRPAPCRARRCRTRSTTTTRPPRWCGRSTGGSRCPRRSRRASSRAAPERSTHR